MERFAFLAAKYGVHIQSGWIANDVHLTKHTRRGRHVITYAHGLPKELQVMGVGLMLGVLVFNWEGKRFGFRFNPPDAHQKLREKEKEQRQEYKTVRKWLAGFLVGDEQRRWLAKEDRVIYDLCWAYDIPRDLVDLAFGIIPLRQTAIAAEREMWSRRENGW